MLHKMFEPGDWFAAKRFGYGAGLPIAWQGWVLVILFVASALGCGLLIETGDFASTVLGLTGLVLSALLFLFVARRRTRGGWKWRSGGRDVS